jgi:hypothetical protein
MLSHMRHITFIALLALLAAAAAGADRFLPSASYPRLRIKSATTPIKRPELMKVTLEMSAEGKGPVALSQGQIGVTVSPYPYVYVKPTFETNAPLVFIIRPDKPVIVSFTVPTANFRPGKQRFDVGFGSGKTQEFDYQFLGQGHSENYEIEVK